VRWKNNLSPLVLRWMRQLAIVPFVLLIGTASPPALAQNEMPPVAPPIQHDGQPQLAPAASPTATTIDEVPATVVRPRNSTQPLTANVSRFGTTGEPLRGATDFMVNVPPGLQARLDQQVAPEVFRAWIEKAHPKFALSASTLPATSVVEVKGAWDDSGKTLRKFQIPFTHIRSGDLRDYPLEQAKVLIINCSGTVPRESLQRIRDFVAHGGYLLSTDWALDNLVQKAFPGYITWNRRINSTGMYDAEVVRPDPVLFQYTVARSNWRLEEECHLCTVLRPDVVRVLVHSGNLNREDGAGVLAVTFPFGRGQVLHLVGHFDNNPKMFRFGNSLPDPAPVIGISLRQAIAGNFVVAGLEGTRIPTAGR
jgi:SAM-dependent methyltransferase